MTRARALPSVGKSTGWGEEDGIRSSGGLGWCSFVDHWSGHCAMKPSPG